MGSMRTRARKIGRAALRGAWILALAGGVPTALFAADESAHPDPFDPRRPPAAELEMSVPDGFTLAAVGDCIISRPLSQKRASDAPFDEAVEVLQGADATFGNLETPILDVRYFEGHPDSGEEDWGLTALPAVAEDLKRMGFDLLSRANNHVLDWGIEGMRETSRWLDAAGLVHGGVGESRGLARAPQYYESEKGRIALVSMASTFKPSSAATPARGATAGRPGLSALRVQRFTLVPPEVVTALGGIQRAMDAARGDEDERIDESPSELSLFGTEFRPGDHFAYQYEMNAIDLAEILASIRLGKQHADFLVATIHAHEPAFDEDSPGDFLRTLAHLAIDAGADAFVAHGIHHLGPIEVYAGKPIFYGLSNFFWSDAQEPLDPILHETYAREIADAFPDPPAVTDADLTALLNAGSFDDERTFQSVIAVSRFEAGGVSEIRLHPIDLGYGLRIPDSGVPRVASPSKGRPILERLQEISAPYGTRIEIRKNVGVIRP
jgi:poly-gamma-glutamate capsule biosynthesis protein CapA/YwtB (metallophosphatase superfamily)